MRDIRLRAVATLLSVLCVTAHAQQSQLTATAPKTGAVPNVIRFSGSFRPSNGMPAQPVESVTLSVYRDQTAGTPLWQETQNVAVDGERHYSLLMGVTQNDGVPLDLLSAGEPLWLGVQFNRPGEPEQPRVLMTSVPYALKSVDAETLGGRPASDYLLAGAAPSGITASVIAASAIAASAGSAAPSTVVTSNTTAVKPRTTTGTAGFIGVFTDANDMGNSVMQQSNGNIGVGTVPGANANTAPSLDVRTYPFSQIGMAQTVDYLTFFASDAYGPAIYWDPTKDLRFGKGGNQLYGAFGFVEQMRIQSSTGNVGIGTQAPASKLDVAGDINLAGSLHIQGAPVLRIFGPVSFGNTALGIGALFSNTTGIANTATGYNALAANTTGDGNTAVGRALGVNTTGNYNTATGDLALESNTTGSSNTAFGDGSMQSNTTANYNTATGAKALEFNTTGSENTASGYSALGNYSTPSGNTAIGFEALLGGAAVNANTGTNNTATGATALASNTTGSDNTASGTSALLQNTTGSENTAIGSGALIANTTGSGNTANGYAALSANLTGSSNTANGQQALELNTTGTLNTAVGNLAMQLRTTGTNNTAVGFQALQGSSVVSDNTGGYNTALGSFVMVNNSGGGLNTAVGSAALAQNTTGNYNVAIGINALASNMSGSSNIAIGSGAGLNLITGSNDIYIGAGAPTSDDGSAIRIGTFGLQSSFFAAGVNTVNLGSDPNAVGVLIDTMTGQLGVTSSSRRYKEDIQDMGEASRDLMRLRPVTFRYKKPFANGSKPIQYGLIAEEVAEVYPDLVARSADGQIETVKYQLLDPMLLNEVQKQYQHAQQQDETIRQQQERIRSLEERLAALEALFSGKVPSATSAGQLVP